MTKAMMDDDNNCFRCLLDAMRRGNAPKRLAVITDARCTASRIKELTLAIPESSFLSELCITEHSTWEKPRIVFKSLLSAAAARDGLKTLDIDYFPHLFAEWESIWLVAASHRTLSAVKIRYRGDSTVHAQRNPRGVDRLQTIEGAVRSNSRLTSIEVTDDNCRHHKTKEFKRRILPILRWNRIITLKNEVKQCPDPSWRRRLFAVSVYRLSQKVDANARPSLLHLLRGNVDLLERCTHVPDVLLRQWTAHLAAIDSHAAHVSHLEDRMIRCGMRAPSTRSLQRCSGSKRTLDAGVATPSQKN